MYDVARCTGATSRALSAQPHGGGKRRRHQPPLRRKGIRSITLQPYAPQTTQQAPAGRSFTAADVRRMPVDPAYACGVNLLPAERVAEAVMQLN
jgi:hypothetical protein